MGAKEASFTVTVTVLGAAQVPETGRTVLAWEVEAEADEPEAEVRVVTWEEEAEAEVEPETGTTVLA